MKVIFLSNLIFCLLLILIVQVEVQGQCPIGETEVIFVISQIPERLCVLDADIIQNCDFYDKVVLTPPYSCLQCKDRYQIIQFDQITQSLKENCVKSSKNPTSNCKVYNNQDDMECLECESGFNTFPSGTNADGETIVQCSRRRLLKTDNADYSSCQVYQLPRRCETCAAFPGTSDVYDSADCSRDCDGNSRKSVHYFSNKQGEREFKCMQGPKADCKLYRNHLLKVCSECFEGDIIAIVKFNQITTSRYCIPSEDFVPGCRRYKENSDGKKLLLGHRYSCQSCEFQSQDSNVRLQYSQANRVCFSEASDIFGSCLTLSEDNLACAECQGGYNLNYELNLCIKRVEFCASYSENSYLCERCIQGHFLSGQICLKISEQCLQVDSLTGVCTSCKDGLIPSEETLGECQVDTSCDSGEFYDTTSGSCIEGTIEGCSVYEVDGQICEECQDGLELEPLVNTCAEIDPAVVCPDATDQIEFQIIDGECREVSVACEQWRQVQESGSLYCFDCQDGFYPFQGRCFPVATSQV